MIEIIVSKRKIKLSRDEERARRAAEGYPIQRVSRLVSKIQVCYKWRLNDDNEWVVIAFQTTMVWHHGIVAAKCTL